ncbi:hypothetical protein [Staphylococcus equorum]|uniref:Uncharacterized protein n=1 Tax=Staphylococcus equorum TaxID=246432 RepID=A0A9X4LAN2_9STAP|nr:hypothetical protein [Staphylococcus equorum]MDG0860341.1 hypothetical protein [Staphylococcus equorum]
MKKIGQAEREYIMSQPAGSRKRGRQIVVLKDGVQIKRLHSLKEAFTWAEENMICNEGWVKRSLKNNEETKPGRKFKEGGYLFQYLE